jgi:uncharacterized membrane protein
MEKNRVEAFSDGVMAIIITIMVLELKTPHDSGWDGLVGLWPVFLSYILSFLFVGLYWVSHHHLFQKVEKIGNKSLWTNMVGLFWLSLVPFCASWMGENEFAGLTVPLYSGVLTMCVISYSVLFVQLRSIHGSHGLFPLKELIRAFITIGLNVTSGLLAFVGFPLIGFGLLVFTSLLWVVPPMGNKHRRKQS